jgi:hypothetical protein
MAPRKNNRKTKVKSAPVASQILHRGWPTQTSFPPLLKCVSDPLAYVEETLERGLRSDRRPGTGGATAEEIEHDLRLMGIPVVVRAAVKKAKAEAPKPEAVRKSERVRKPARKLGE